MCIVDLEIYTILSYDQFACACCVLTVFERIHYLTPTNPLTSHTHTELIYAYATPNQNHSRIAI